MIGCDGRCNRSNVKSRKLSIGGGGNLFLCRSCWAHEMAYRREMNKRNNLKGKNAWSIRKYPG